MKLKLKTVWNWNLIRKCTEIRWISTKTCFINEDHMFSWLKTKMSLRFFQPTKHMILIERNCQWVIIIYYKIRMLLLLMFVAGVTHTGYVYHNLHLAYTWILGMHCPMLSSKYRKRYAHVHKTLVEWVCGYFLGFLQPFCVTRFVCSSSFLKVW